MTAFKLIMKIAAQVATWLLALLTVLAAFCGYIPPQIMATPSIVALAFPWLVLLLLAVLIVWLSLRKILPSIVCGAALVLSSGAIFTNFPLRGSKSPKPNEKTFTMLTYNVFHGENVRPQDGAGPNATFNYLINCGADILSLQELGSLTRQESPALTDEVKQRLEQKYPYRVFVNDTIASSVFSKYPVTLERKGVDYILVRVSLPGLSLQLMNVHLSSYKLTAQESSVISQKNNQSSIRKRVEEFRGPIAGKLKEAFRNRAEAADEVRTVINETSGPLVVAGDFNDVPGSWAYRVVRGDDLKDAYTQTGFGMMITYNLHGFYFHIDQVLYRADPLRALSVDKQPQNTSDHYPLLCTFAY